MSGLGDIRLWVDSLPDQDRVEVVLAPGMGEADSRDANALLGRRAKFHDSDSDMARFIGNRLDDLFGCPQ